MLSRIPPWLRAAIITGLQTLVGSLLLIVLSLILDVNDWLSDPTNPVDLSGPAKLALAAVVTFVSFIVTAVYRAIRPPQNTYPEAPTKADIPPAQP
jgi:hypothetical protein